MYVHQELWWRFAVYRVAMQYETNGSLSSLRVCVSSSAETRLDSEDGHSHSNSVNDSYMLGAKAVNEK